MNEERYQEGTSIRFKGVWFSQRTVRSIIFSWRTPRFQGQERRLSKTEVGTGLEGFILQVRGAQLRPLLLSDVSRSAFNKDKSG